MDIATVMAESIHRSSGEIARPAKRAFHVIGLLGGVASGKSFVAGELQRLGAVVLDADRVGHDVLRLPEVKRAVSKRWGDAALDADGQVNRAALARIVF